MSHTYKSYTMSHTYESSSLSDRDELGKISYGEISNVEISYGDNIWWEIKWWEMKISLGDQIHIGSEIKLASLGDKVNCKTKWHHRIPGENQSGFFCAKRPVCSQSGWFYRLKSAVDKSERCTYILFSKVFFESDRCESDQCESSHQVTILSPSDFLSF